MIWMFSEQIRLHVPAEMFGVGQQLDHADDQAVNVCFVGIQCLLMGCTNTVGKLRCSIIGWHDNLAVKFDHTQICVIPKWPAFWHVVCVSSMYTWSNQLQMAPLCTNMLIEWIHKRMNQQCKLKKATQSYIKWSLLSNWLPNTFRHSKNSLTDRCLRCQHISWNRSSELSCFSFLPCHMECRCGLAMRLLPACLSICPFVCPSVKCVNCD